MALPTAPPMMRPSATAVRREDARASQIHSNMTGDGLEREQRPLPERPILLEQPVADAPVPGQHQVEERGQGHDAAGAEIEAEQHPELERLVDDGAGQRHAEAEAAERPPRQGRSHIGGGGHYSAALRIASHSRSAWASRGETSG